MKNKLTLIIGIAIVMFLWQACEFVRVNTPDLNLSKNYQAEYVINGVVTNDAGPVAGAVVNIAGTQVITDGNGAYSYKTNSYPASGTLIQVEINGYVNSTMSLTYTGTPPLLSSYDFTLTPRNGPQVVTSANGGHFVFGDVTVDVPSNNQFKVNGQVQSSIYLDVTSLNTLSMLGESVYGIDRSLKTFSFDPDGTVFLQPIKISFNAPDGFVYSNELKYMVLNDLTNQWEYQTNLVKYDDASKTISVEVSHFSNGKIVDPSTITITTGPVVQTEFLQRLTASSCDCEGPYVYEGEYSYTRKIVNAYTGPSAATWQELLLFNVLVDNYIPYSQNYVNGITTTGVINPTAIGTCDLMTWDLSYLVKRVAGHFVYNGEVKYFDVKYYFGIQSTFTDNQACPTSSGCHQGCQ